MPLDSRSADRVSAQHHPSAREGARVAVDVRLVRAAQVHAEDMAAGAVSGYRGSDGSLPADRADRVNYPWLFVAENSSAGFATAPSAFAAWMASPMHRANSLQPEAEHVGVGYAENDDTEDRA